MTPHPTSIQGDLRHLPTALAPLVALDQWVLWRWEKTKAENGEERWTKVPYQHTRLKAMSNTPRTWSSYDMAMSVILRDNYDGIGFCLLNGNIAAFDIDKCRDPTTGEIDPWAADLVARTGSYAEITVSGTGLRIIGYGKGPKLHRKLPVHNGVSLEAYRRSERYIVITGNPLPEAGDIINIDASLDATVAELEATKAQGKAKTKASKTKAGKDPPMGVDALPVSKRIKDLIRGKDYPDHPYPSRSERVFAVIVAMVGTNCTDDQIAAILLDAGYPISAHVLEQGNPQAYLEKQIGSAREERAKRIPVISKMRKNDDPDNPIWYVTIGNKEIEIPSEKDLGEYRRFNNQCIRQLDRCFAPLKPQEWADILDNALANMEIVKAPEETTNRGQFQIHMQQLLTARVTSTHKEDLLRVPWDDENNRQYHFTINMVQEFLIAKKVLRDVSGSVQQIAKLLHAIGAIRIPKPVTIKGKEQRRCWWIGYDKITKIPDYRLPDEEEQHI